jgi:site-specific DNA recombinase
MKNQKKYFTYCRGKSTQEFGETSITLQEKIIEDYVVKNDLTVIKNFADVDSHNEFEQMINAINNGEANGIIEMDESRISRAPAFRYEILEALDKGLIDEVRTMNTIYKNNPNSKLMLSMVMGICVFETTTMSERIKRGIAAKKAKTQGVSPIN